MAQATHITVRYARKVSPAQYESEEAVIEGSFALDDGEDFEALSYDMLTRARVQAHRALGRPEPVIGEYSPAFEEFEVAPAAKMDAYGNISVEGGATIQQVVGDKPKRKRRTKAEMEDDKAEAATAEVWDRGPTNADPLEGLSGEEKPKQDPDISDFDIEPAEVSDQDLTKAAAAASRAAGPGGAEKVKAVMAEFGVQRMGMLPKERRAEFIKALANIKA